MAIALFVMEQVKHHGIGNNVRPSACNTDGRIALLRLHRSTCHRIEAKRIHLIYLIHLSGHQKARSFYSYKASRTFIG